MGWILDTGFKANAVTDGDGYWHFDDLEVAGRRNIDGKQTMVLYGYRAYVDDLPKNYGVTLMNQGSDANADSDLDEMTKILDPADPQGGMLTPRLPTTACTWWAPTAPPGSSAAAWTPSTTIRVWCPSLWPPSAARCSSTPRRTV